MKRKIVIVYLVLFISLFGISLETVSGFSSHPDNILDSSKMTWVTIDDYFLNYLTDTNTYHEMGTYNGTWYLGILDSNRIKRVEIRQFLYENGSWNASGTETISISEIIAGNGVVPVSFPVNGQYNDKMQAIQLDVIMEDGAARNYDATSAHIQDIEASLYFGMADPTADITNPEFSGGGVYFANVSNPSTINEIKSTLTATDETDGDLTNSIVLESDDYSANSNVLGDYNVVFSVTDSSNNTSYSTVTVRVVDVTKPIITLNGNSTVYIEYLDIYNDQDAIWSDDYDGSDTLIGSGTVNSNILGNYFIEFNYTDSSGNVADTVTRTVVVQDTTRPIITLNGSSSINLNLGDIYNEEGANWTDNYDGNGTANISGIVDTNIVGEQTVLYDYTDSNGNVADTVTRTITINDNISPTISLLGESIVYIEYGGVYSEPGATWSDNYDGTGEVPLANITDNIDLTRVGTYTVEYNYSDSSGNPATTITRTVVIEDTVTPIIQGLDNVSVFNSDGVRVEEILSQVTVEDNYDGNLTNNLYVTDNNYIGNEHKVGTYTFTVVVKDSNNNETTVITTVTVLDDIRPTWTYTDDLLTEAEANAMTQADIVQYIKDRK
ncbi:MAG: DUF5011 domain-containing protein [Candidatus Izimaplasma sp.]|nr:DUF5011 domain-containing protein [Candidatus Izimaplasma bacterium]